MAPSKTSTVPWVLIRPGFAVLSTALLTGLVLFAGSFFLAVHWDKKRQFLKNDRPPNNYESPVQCLMTYVNESTEANQVVFLGGSCCALGIRTLRFEELTGKKAYNLGSIGAIGIDGYLLVLQSYLRRHPKPQVVVLCLQPIEICGEPSTLGPKETRDRFFDCFSENPLKRPKITPALIQQNIKTGSRVFVGLATGCFIDYANKPIPGLDGITYNQMVKDIRKKRGYFEVVGGLPTNNLRGVDPKSPFTILAANQEKLCNLGRFARENGIILLVRLTPILKGDSADNFHQISAQLRELEAACPGVIVGRPEVIEYEPRFLFAKDPNHLNRDGADAFTGLVAKEVMSVLSGRSLAKEETWKKISH